MVAQLTRSANRSSSSAGTPSELGSLELFQSTVPLGYAGNDTNLFRYVGNGPTNAVDPTGEYEWTQEILQSPQPTIEGRLGYSFRVKQTFAAGQGENAPRFADGAQTWQVSFIRAFALVQVGDKISIEEPPSVTKLDIVDITPRYIENGKLVHRDTIASAPTVKEGRIIMYVESTIKKMGFNPLDDAGKIKTRLRTGVNRAPDPGDLEKLKETMGPTLTSNILYVYMDRDECNKALQADLEIVNDWLGGVAKGTRLPALPDKGKFEFLQVNDDEWHYPRAQANPKPKNAN